MLSRERWTEVSIAAAACTAGTAFMSMAWTLAIRGRGLPWSLQALLDVHRQEPMLFLVPFLPALATVVSVAYARALQQVRTVREQIERERAVRQPDPAAGRHLPHVPVPLIAVDPADRILELNPAAELLFGCGSNEAAHCHVSQLLREPSEDDGGEPCRLRRGDAVGVRWVTTAHHRDGAAFEVVVAALGRAGGVARCLVILDPPEARGAGDAMSLIAAIGREIKVPANLVHACARIALHDTSVASQPTLAADLGRIHRGSRQLQRLADDLLDLSRQHAVAAAATTEGVDLVALCRALLLEVGPDGAAGDITLDLRNTAPRVRTDPDRLGRILLRLLRSTRTASGAAARRIVIWSEHDAVHLEARGDAGDPAPEIGDLDARTIEAVASAVGITVHPSDDGRLWRLSLPLVGANSDTPRWLDERTLTIEDIRNSSSDPLHLVASEAAPEASPIAPPSAPIRAAAPALAPARQSQGPTRRRRRGLLARRGIAAFDAIPTAVQRVTVLDPDEGTRTALERALSDRGFEVTPLERGELGQALRHARPQAVVAHARPDLKALAALTAQDEEFLLLLVALDSTAEAGCRLRADSVHLASDARQRVAALAQSVYPAGTAIVLLPRGEERRSLASALDGAGWAVVETGRVESAEHRLAAGALHLLVADPTLPGVPNLLARLAVAGKGVEHVALHLPPIGVAGGPGWLETSPERRPLDQLAEEVAGVLNASRLLVGVGA